VKTANATYAAVGWGHLANWDQNEYYWEDMVTSCIIYDFAAAGWDNMDCYWTYTTGNNVYSSLAWMQYNIDWVTTWWVGDYLFSYGHYGFNGYGGDHIWDCNVYSYINDNGASKQYFNFIWTCANGGVYWDDMYGNQDPITGIDVPEDEIPWYTPTNTHTWYGYLSGSGVVGMPYAWTGDTPTMGNDYCYVGFETSSPFLKNTPPGGWTSTGYQYGYVPYYFYEFALGYDNYGVHGTIIESLDYAAGTTFGHDNNNNPYTFQSSILNHGNWFYTSLQGMEGWWYWRMRVFGDSGMVLPEY
jgi:hypothetical protein